MSTLKTNNIEHLDASTPSVQTTIGGGTVVTGICTFNNKIVPSSGTLNIDGSISIGGTITYEDVSNIDSVGIITAQAGIRVTGGSVAIGTDTAATSDTFLQVTNPAAHTEVVITSKNDSGSIINMGDVDDYNIGRIKYDNSTDSMQIQTNNAERVRVDNSGNLLVGTTTVNGKMSVEMATDKVISFNGSQGEVGSVPAILASNSAGNALASMGFRATDLRFATGSAERVRITSGGQSIFMKTVNNSDDLLFGYGSSTGIYAGIGGYNNFSTNQLCDLTFWTNGSAGSCAPTERMRIDSSGRVLINATSTGSIATAAPLQVVAGDGAWGINLRCRTNNDYGFLAFTSHDSNEALADIYSIRNGTSIGALGFGTNNGNAATSEAMRLDENGQLLLLANSNPITARSTASASTSTEYFTGLYGATQNTTGGTVAIKIYTNGNIQNTNNSYGSLSDSKLKENIIDASSQWDDIKGIRVRNYNLIEGQTHTQLGVIAQEVEAVSPGLVYETPDKDNDGNDLGTVTKGVNYSVLYMKAVKALQESMTRIETLEAEVAALKGS